MLERQEKSGLCFFPIIIRPCPWKQVEWLTRMQVYPRDGIPLSVKDKDQIDDSLTEIIEEVAAIIASQK